jgi:hypothetical protein
MKVKSWMIAAAIAVGSGGNHPAFWFVDLEGFVTPRLVGLRSQLLL